MFVEHGENIFFTTKEFIINSFLIVETFYMVCDQ